MAFEEIRACLANALVLCCPNLDVSFKLLTDASNTGSGALLTRNIDGVEYMVSYVSRNLSSAEQQYNTIEKECLAVIYTIQKFHAHLEGCHFTFITDHSILRWLHKLKSPTARLAR